MNATRPILTILVPVKDEEESIAPFVARVGQVLNGLSDPAAKAWEILFVDDGSSDATLAAIVTANAANKRVCAVSLSRNFGKDAQVDLHVAALVNGRLKVKNQDGQDLASDDYATAPALGLTVRYRF